MLSIQFLGQNLHFAINLFAAMVFFAVFWLYFDAWIVKRRRKDIIKIIGFLLIALSFLVQATVIDQSVLKHSLFGSFSQTLAMVVRLAGYLAVVVGLLNDPLQLRPETHELEASEFIAASEPAAEPALPPVHAKNYRRKVQAVVFGGTANVLHCLLPLGALTIAVLYWRRATTGLERHLKPIAAAFFILFLSELLSLSNLWQSSTNPLVAHWTASFGPIWFGAELLLFASVALLGRWVWRYLIERFISQLFMVFIGMTLAIFLVTTVSFTFLLVNNVQKSALDNLQTSSSVLNYAINSKKAETLADAQALAANPAIVAAVSAGAHEQLLGLTTNFLHDKQQSSLVVTNNVGQVLLRAEDPERFGDSLSSDTLVRRSLIGRSNSTVATQDGVLAPLIYIKSSTPIEDAQGNIVGSATVGLVVDNAFVDGIKHATGLDTAIYAGDVRSATTFLAPDGVSRWIGVKEDNATVQSTVLKHGQIFRGSISVLNRQFLGVYAPLKDVDNTVLGMLFIGQSSLTIIQTAGHSIELTFLLAVLLLVLSIVPAYIMARYIARQLE